MDALDALPTSFEAARAALEPRLVGSTAGSISLLELWNAGNEGGAAATLPVASDLNVGAVVMTPIGGVQISAGLLEKWGVSIEQVVEAAIKNSFGRDIHGAAQIGEGTFAIEDEAFAAAAVFRPSMLAGFDVVGATVIMAPSTGVLLVTGSDDEQGLLSVATLADATIGKGEKLVSATAFQLDGARLSEFAWPASGEVASTVRVMTRRWASTIYNWQAPALRAMLAASAKNIFVADAVPTKSPSDGVITYSTVMEGTVTALPVTDVVVLVNASGGVSQCSWASLSQTLGAELEALEVVPPRFVVATFPSADQLAQLRP